MTIELHTQTNSPTAPNNVAEILQQVENIMQDKGVRFTRIRKHIYKILLDAPQPLGAYDIIERLDGIGAQKPPTVYRALAWLIDAGLVAKIAYNSRYTPMPLDLKPENVAFLICEGCGSTDVFEANSTRSSLRQTAKNRGFADLNMVIEIIGKCCEPTPKVMS